MGIWKTNEEKKISALWTGSNPNLVAHFKLENTVEWTEIGSLSSIGDDLYAVSYTFINEGNFIIRVKDENTGVSIFSKIEVINPIEGKGFV
jgi:hypothetical protein